MPDSITPVGAMVNPPNPQAGLSNLSSILGIAQQSQNLQTGQYRQQEAQAGAQSAQQAMSERQIMVQSLRSGKDPDGQSIMADSPDPVTGRPAPDPNKLMAMARRWMPQTGDAVIQNITKTQSDKAALAEATRGLEQNYRNDLSGVVQAFKTDDPSLPNNAKAKDVTSAIDAYITKNPAAAAAGHWASNLVNDHFDNMTAAQKNDALQHIAQVFQPAATTAAQNLPQPAVTAAGTVNRGAVHGGLSQPPGAATGSAINPTPPQVAGATAQATGGAGRDVDRANAVSTAQQSASASLPLTFEVDRLSHEISASAIAGKVTEGLKNLGFTDIANARSQLNKDLGLLKGPLALRAASDTRAATVLEGYPTETTPENTTHAAMDYIRGMFRQTMGRGQLLKRNGQNGFASADDELTRSTDPLVYEAASLKPGQSNGFYKRNFGSPQEAQTFKNRVDALKKHTVFLGGPSE